MGVTMASCSPSRNNQQIDELELTKNDLSNYNFSFKKSIAEELELTFHLMIEIDELGMTVLRNILIMDEYSKIMQELKNLNSIIWHVEPSEENFFGITFADYDFNGFLDFSIPRVETSGFLRFVNGWFYHYLWDNEVMQFTLNEQLIELEEVGFWQVIDDFQNGAEIFEMGNSHIYLDEEMRMLVFESALAGNWSYFSSLERHLSWEHVFQYYQYINGEFVLVRIKEITLYDHSTWRIRELDIITGMETVFYTEE